MKIEVDVVVPVYNSTKVLKNLTDRLNDLAVTNSVLLHVYFVDDGSIDDSFEYLKTLQCHFNFTAIKLENNYGQHPATAIGLSFCKSEYCVTLDDDLQHNPLDIPLLIKEINDSGSDLVYGSFNRKNHNFVRNIGSWLIKKVVNKDNINYDKVTSYRIMRLSIAQQFSIHAPSVRFIDEFLLGSAKKVGSVEVTHRSAEGVKSRYTSINLIRFAFQILIFHSNFASQFIIRWGICFTVIFFSLFAYFTDNDFLFHESVGFFALISGILFTSSLLLLSFGIFAQYLRKKKFLNTENVQVAINNIYQFITHESMVNSTKERKS